MQPRQKRLHSFLLSSGCSRHGTKKLVPSSGRSHGGPRSSSDRTIGLGLGLGLATLTITCATTTTTNNPSIITHHRHHRRRLLQIKCKFVLSLHMYIYTTTCVKLSLQTHTCKAAAPYIRNAYGKSTSIDCKNEERSNFTLPLV